MFAIHADRMWQPPRERRDLPRLKTLALTETNFRLLRRMHDRPLAIESSKDEQSDNERCQSHSQDACNDGPRADVFVV